MRKVLIILSIACLIFGIDIYIAQETIWPRPIQYITTLSLDSRDVVFVQDSVGFSIVGEDIADDFQTFPYTEAKPIVRADSVYLFWSSPIDSLTMTLHWRKIFPINGVLNSFVIPQRDFDLVVPHYRETFGFLLGLDSLLYDLDDRDIFFTCPSGYRIVDILNWDALEFVGMLRVREDSLPSDDYNICNFNYRACFPMYFLPGELVYDRGLVSVNSSEASIGENGHVHSELKYICMNFDTHFERFTLPPIFDVLIAVSSTLDTLEDLWEVTKHNIYRSPFPVSYFMSPIIGNFTGTGDEYILGNYFATEDDSYLIDSLFIIYLENSMKSLDHTALRRFDLGDTNTIHCLLSIPSNNLVLDFDNDSTDELVIFLHDTLRIYGFRDEHDIAEQPRILPDIQTLSAYPNPFNASVSISAPKNTEIEIFDLNGKLICTLPKSPDNSETIWSPDATLSSGIYLVRAKSDAVQSLKRVVYLR